MTVKLVRVGEELGVVVLDEVLEKVGIGLKTQFSVTVEAGEIVVRPIEDTATPAKN